MTPSWRVWVSAARPATLPAAVTPVLVGTGVAVREGHFQALLFLGALLAAALIQVGTNLANDLFDFEKGADAAGRLGPPRVTQTGAASPEQVRRATYLTFAAAGLVGLYLVLAGGWPILAIGLASIAAGLTYTGGPWPTGYHGLGDAVCFLFFGFIAVVGTYYLQARTISPLALAAAVPVSCIVTAILVVNNLRDTVTDRRAGKRTLAVILGDTPTRAEYVILMAAAYLVAAAIALSGAAPWAWLPWLTLPLGASLVRTVLHGATGASLNDVLRRTAQLHLLFGVLLAAGLIV